MNNVMLDLETMGLSPTSAIVSIGAVRFDFQTGLGDTFYKVVDLESAVNSGLNLDASTVQWWMQQSDAAREVFKQQGEPLSVVLMEFARWLGAPKEVVMWGNGSDFDNVILRNAYEVRKQYVPWMFWNNRCYRTVKSLFPEVKPETPVIKHHALEDAKAQALTLIKMLGEKK
jgi:exodeoxyribonuclease VIII